MQSRESGGLGYYVAAGVLILALGSFFLLSALLVKTPAGGAAFSTGSASPADCVGGGKHATCYRVTVTNTGTKAAVLTCGLQPASGTDANFFSGGLSTYISSKPIDPQFPVPLLIVVTGKKPHAPAVACASAP